MTPVYLDYAADTPPDTAVLQCYLETAQQVYANPNAAHNGGVSAKQTVDAALSEMADLLGVTPDTLILTSGASEANNLAIKGIAHTNRRRGKHIVSTFLEHASVSGALTFLQEQGWEIDLVKIQSDGKIDLAHLQRLLREDTVLCAVCAVDSELGTVQPVREITELIHKCAPNCRLHIDATQAIGKIPFDFHFADTVSFAPHKFYGLKGCGVLYKASGVVLEPLIHGGASTTIYRSGTPDPAAAAACAKALSAAVQMQQERYETVVHFTEYLRERLSEIDGIFINSPDDSIPHILNISVPKYKGGEIQNMLNQRGIYVSVKSACSVPNTPSRAVLAVTQEKARARSSFRISLSHLTTTDELDLLIGALKEI